MRRVAAMWFDDGKGNQPQGLTGSRFEGFGKALEDASLDAVAIPYRDDLAETVLADLLAVDAVQVWVNPIADGHDRTVLDHLLRDVAGRGVRVFTHPDTIMRMGTKRVLVDLAGTSFGSEVVEYRTLSELSAHLPNRLLAGARVLKQFRGHSGGGIWKFELASPSPSVDRTTPVLLRHAERGAPEELLSLGRAIERMAPYFEKGNSMFEQAYQDRIGVGMIRIYLVGGEVAGFGRQEAVALAPAGPNGQFPEMGPRLYYPPDEAQFRPLREQMERKWLGELLTSLSLREESLPLLWDLDLMFGPKDPAGQDTYVLCEINVSCVSPYPRWADPLMAAKLKALLQA